MPIKNVYCVGISRPNPGPAAHSMVVQQGNGYVEWDALYYKKETTTQRMELISLYVTLNRILEEHYLFQKSVTINVYSPYIRRAILDWLPNQWIPQGWKKSGDREIANGDLWKAIYHLLQVKEMPQIEWDWERGREGNAVATANCLRAIETNRLYTCGPKIEQQPKLKEVSAQQREVALR